MKLLGILLGLILMIHVTSSVPVDTEENKVMEAMAISSVPIDIEKNKDAAVSNIHEEDGEPDTAVPNVHEEDGEPTEEYLAEIRAYFEEQKQKNSTEMDKRQTDYTVYHGDPIALQTYDRTHWLSCYDNYCNRQVCPGMYMTGADWINCWGEVFEIYRASGPGAVRVGDLVGLHYRAQRGYWLGCASNNCRKENCPGHPTRTYGFASRNHWSWCWGEVYKIYALGKRNGEVINIGNNIMLFYVYANNWLSQGPGASQKLPCPGTVRPPPFERFDFCSWETFTIW